MMIAPTVAIISTWWIARCVVITKKNENFLFGNMRPVRSLPSPYRISFNWYFLNSDDANYFFSKWQENTSPAFLMRDFLGGSGEYPLLAFSKFIKDVSYRRRDRSLLLSWDFLICRTNNMSSRVPEVCNWRLTILSAGARCVIRRPSVNTDWVIDYYNRFLKRNTERDYLHN